MRVTSDMINPQLRPTGVVARKLLPYYTNKQFHQANRLADKLLRGRWLGVHTSWREAWLERPDGSKLRVGICAPRRQVKNAVGLLWIHGGGYAMGVPETDFPYMEMFARARDCVIVAPDYRRSTEAPYPAALEDCYQALLYLASHAAELGARDDQLFVGGDSAGGGLTAAITLYARDKGEVNIAFQMPLFPMLDDRTATESARENDAPFWNAKSNEEGWRLYLGDDYRSERVSQYAAPARCRDFGGLPPAVTYVGTIDAFHDETVAYVDGLREAGVPVMFKEFEGCFHGFDMICPQAQVARDARRFLAESFVCAAENYFAPQRGEGARDIISGDSAVTTK